jgi:DNA invertase Pin-like site-specific DNA recombinase
VHKKTPLRVFFVASVGPRLRIVARKKAEGVVLGRPKGRKSSHLNLSGKEILIRDLLRQDISKSEIARILKVNRMTIASFIKLNRLADDDIK